MDKASSLPYTLSFLFKGYRLTASAVLLGDILTSVLSPQPTDYSSTSWREFKVYP